MPVAEAAFSIGNLLRVSGDAPSARAALLAQLTDLGIDVGGAEKSDATDVEAVSQLISVARQHGYSVEMSDGETAPLMRVVKPSNVRMLQSGHHRQNT